MPKETKIVIKQIPNPDNPNLGIKYVGAKEYGPPKIGRDGKVITGVDEFSLDITTLEEAERKKKSKEIQSLRESLEKVLGVDLKPESPFWDTFSVILGDDDLVLDPLNPRDQLIERFVVANKYVAPSLEAVSNDEDYQNCLFYLYREEEEITRSAQKQKFLDKATSKLFQLNEDDPNKVKVLTSYIFGFDAEADLSVEAAYVKLKEFLEVKDKNEQKKNVKTFLEACEKSTEEIVTKQIFDKALKKRIVTSKGNIYRRGDEVYGNNYDEALEFISLPEHSGELNSLRKQVSASK